MRTTLRIKLSRPGTILTNQECMSHMKNEVADFMFKLLEKAGLIDEIDVIKFENISKYPNPNGGTLRVKHYEILTSYINRLNLAKDINICDVSTGNGHMIWSLNNSGYHNIIGVDRINPNTEHLDSNRFEIVRTDIDEYGLSMLDSNIFDLVISSETIEHLHNPYQFVQELCRITKKDGVILITTPNIDNIRRRLEFLVTGELPFFPEISEDKVRTQAGHISPITDSVFRNYIKTTNYEIHNEFGDFGVSPFGNRWVGHKFSYSKGYDIRHKTSSVNSNCD